MIALGTGLVAGGLTTGIMLLVASGVVQASPAEFRYVALWAFVIGAILREFRIVPMPLPQRSVPVPKSVIERVPDRAALRFGFELGLGFRTLIPSTAPYLFAVALLLVAGWSGTFLAAGAGFGVGRLIMAMERYGSWDGDKWDHRLHERKGTLQRSSTLVVAVGVAVLSGAS